MMKESKLPHSSAVERLTVNQRVVGSNPTAAAIRRKSFHQQGFTLIELLVVIAVLAVLMGFLFPVVQKARSQAQKLQCASNLRQIVMAWTMYAHDHDDEACPMSYRSENGDKTWYWDSFSDQEAKKDPISSDDPRSIKRYIKSPTSVCCPCFRRHDSNSLMDKERRSSTGYGYNATYIGGDAWWGPDLTDIPSCHLSHIKDPSSTAVFADAEYWEDKMRPYGLRATRWLRSPDEKSLKEQGKRAANNYQNGTVHFRHNHTANVAFADGHVKAVPNRNYELPFKDQAPNCGALHPDDAKYTIDE